MAVIDIANCTVTISGVWPGARLVKVVTPATADDGDTVDVSTVTVPKLAFCEGATDGRLAAASSVAGVVTIPGATDNEARTIWIIGS